MRWLLSLLVALFVVGDIFDIPMSTGPGLSAKNALLYVPSSSFNSRSCSICARCT